MLTLAECLCKACIYALKLFHWFGMQAISTECFTLKISIVSRLVQTSAFMANDMLPEYPER